MHYGTQYKSNTINIKKPIPSSRSTPNAQSEELHKGKKYYSHIQSPNPDVFNMPNRSHLVESTTNRYEKFSLIFNGEGNNNNNLYCVIDQVSDMKCKIISQTNIIKEYDNWINLLLNIVNTRNETTTNNTNADVIHYDLATPVQKVS